MPDDATESVAKHCFRLQPSINLYATVTTFMFSCMGPMFYLGGMKAGVSPVQCAVIKPYRRSAPGTHSGLEPGQKDSLSEVVN